MKDITRHIIELLFRHDCVILPSFGGFIGNYRPAGIDRETNRFTPPVKAISFNRNLVHNDGLLIGKISEEKKIGYADSKILVDSFIDELKKGLGRGERENLDKIEHFQLNSEGNIQFEPNPDTNFLLDSYGFGAFTRQPVSNYDIIRRSTGRDQQSVRPSATRKMAIRAAIAVPVIAAMILIPLKTDFFRNNASMNPLSAIDISVDSSMDDPAANNVAEFKAGDENKPAEVIEQDKAEPVAVNEEPVNTLNVKPAGPQYCIVAGSFKSQDNAKTLADEARSKGFEASLIEAANGYTRVSLGLFASRQDAIDRRYEILAAYPDCWVTRK